MPVPVKLWVDDTVDQAVPAGAAPVTLPAATTVPVPSTTPTTVAPATVAPTTLPPTTTVPVPVSAMFVSLDHGTSGRLVLLEAEGGQRFVRFEELDTSNGDHLDLGRLQGNVGNQNYELPSGTDLTRFRSVVIWCDRFNSAFGAAPLA